MENRMSDLPCIVKLLIWITMKLSKRLTSYFKAENAQTSLSLLLCWGGHIIMSNQNYIKVCRIIHCLTK